MRTFWTLGTSNLSSSTVSTQLLQVETCPSPRSLPSLEPPPCLVTEPWVAPPRKGGVLSSVLTDGQSLRLAWMTLTGPKVLMSPAGLPLSHSPPSMQNDGKAPLLTMSGSCLNLRTPAYWPTFTESPNFLTGPGLPARAGPALHCAALLPRLAWQASASSHLPLLQARPFPTRGRCPLGSLAWCTFPALLFLWSIAVSYLRCRVLWRPSCAPDNSRTS